MAFILKKIIIIIIFISLSIIFILVWAFYIEPNILEVKHYEIRNNKLAGIRIVFASDFHLKNSEEKKLEKIVKKINKQNPDLVLLGGDFVNGQSYENTMDIKKIGEGISKIQSKHGTFAVLGNHDCWLDADAITSTLKKNNIVVLSNNNRFVKIHSHGICIAGVEDFMSRSPDIEKALQNTKLPVILMSHSPDIFPQVPNFVDLTLAAHTHGGQIKLPFYGPLFVPSDFGNKYAQGFIKENGKKMIVSKGIGTSTIYARFNCFPEIVVIDFNHR